MALENYRTVTVHGITRTERLIGYGLEGPQWEPVERAALLTHYVPKFTQQVNRLQRAACGALVDPTTQHSDEPACEACAVWLNPPEADAPRDPMSGSACSAACGYCGCCSSAWERDE